MSNFTNKILLFFVFQFLTGFLFAQNLKISELMSANRQTIVDENNEYPDWFEIVNTGSTEINLLDYSASDNKEFPQKWQFPEIVLEPNKPLLIFASGKDKRRIPSNWMPLITDGDEWNYVVPDSTISLDWNNLEYDDSAWESGYSGIGFGDDDDRTEIAKGSISVFMRKTFLLTEADSLYSLFFHIDFDDAFVAYLNGTEIARMNIGERGDTVLYFQSAFEQHEAQIISGGVPERFDISRYIDSLNVGENVLAVQVHNIGTGSSDFSAIPFLTAAFHNRVNTEKMVYNFLDLPVFYNHTNFKLSSKGEILCLANKNGEILDSISFKKIPSGYSYGRETGNSNNIGYIQHPSPGELNNGVIFTEKVESEVSFSTTQTFFDAPVQLTLSGAADNEEIRYTLNGDDPDRNNSEKFIGPLTLTDNSVVRASVFRDNAVPGTSASKTLIFNDSSAIPVVSLTCDPKNLWDNETGIYILGDDYEEERPHKGANYWEEWEKPAAIEMQDKDGNQLFSANCGIKIFGGWSRMQDQKSLAVFFRNEYGQSSIENTPLFSSKPVAKFSSLVLRNAGNDGSFGKMRDGMMTSLVRNMHTDIQAYQPTTMYLNGEYWGVINLREKVNEDFLENNYGVNADSVDLLQWNASVVEGSNLSYLNFIEMLEALDMNQENSVDSIEKYIDVENYMDYQLSQIYFNNRDWPGNNIKYWRPQTPGGKWRWIMFDTDFGFNIYRNDDHTLNTLEFALEENGPGWPNPPWSTFIFRKFVQNQHLRNRFINRYADMLNTTFTPENVLHHIDSLVAQIQPEMERHKQKWGVPWNWAGSVDNMKIFARQRADYSRKHIKDVFDLKYMHNLYTSIWPAQKGIIQLNSIEIREGNWQGIYFQDVPVKLTARPKAGYKFYRWMVGSKIFTDETIEINLSQNTNVRAFFQEDEGDGNSIVINEINYHSLEGNSAGDWVELYNWGRSDLDISNWILKDSDDLHSYVIPENTIIKSGEYLVLCKNIENFSTVHPEVLNYIGEFGFGLSSLGDEIRLYDELGDLVDKVIFGSESPWPVEPNGGGQTLELQQYYQNNENADNWKTSLTGFGTPGKENSITTDAEWITDWNEEPNLKVYPNPFFETTRISINNNYSLSSDIQIYSIDGRVVKSITNHYGDFIWDGTNNLGQKLNYGIYVCKVSNGAKIFTGKVILGVQ